MWFWHCSGVCWSPLDSLRNTWLHSSLIDRGPRVQWASWLVEPWCNDLWIVNWEAAVLSYQKERYHKVNHGSNFLFYSVPRWINQLPFRPFGRELRFYWKIFAKRSLKKNVNWAGLKPQVHWKPCWLINKRTHFQIQVSNWARKPQISLILSDFPFHSISDKNP